jgi:hypothetical protein
MTGFDGFLNQFIKSFKGNDLVICDVLANVFSMRVIGNKTHGDLAEIALTEYVNEYVDGYSAKHTGKETFRAKVLEEDIRVTNDSSKETISISVKTYGSGPLQLSTNKDSSMFSHLAKNRIVEDGEVTDPKKIRSIINSSVFTDFNQVNVLPLIYNEKSKTFKIIIFDLAKAYSSVRKIKFLSPRKFGANRVTHPIYKFYGKNDEYIFEVRYGDTMANALQRGMWTHTENAKNYFKEILKGSYEINEPLINLIAKILVCPKKRHQEILKLFPVTKKPI